MNAPLTPEREQEIRARHAAITDAPWGSYRDLEGRETVQAGAYVTLTEASPSTASPSTASPWQTGAGTLAFLATILTVGVLVLRMDPWDAVEEPAAAIRTILRGVAS
jgi:hypothetical protein